MRLLTRAVMLFAACLVPVLLVAAAPNPGVVFELEILSRPGATPLVVQTSIEGQNAHIKNGTEADVIYHGATHELLMVNHAAKNYTVLDEASMQAMSAQLAQLQQMLQNVPEAQRAQMEQMMRGRMGGGAPAAPIEVKATTERSTQGGFPTTKYIVSRGGVKTQELWVTPWSNIDGFREAQPVLESLADMFKSLTGALQQLASDPNADTMARMKELGGYPVITQNFDATGQPTSRTALKAVKRQAVPATEFEAPAGYASQTMPGMPGGPGRQGAPGRQGRGN